MPRLQATTTTAVVIANRVSQIRITRDGHTVTQREFRGRVARLARVFSASRVLERLANVELRVKQRAVSAIVINSDIARVRCAHKGALRQSSIFRLSPKQAQRSPPHACVTCREHDLACPTAEILLLR